MLPEESISGMLGIWDGLFQFLLLRSTTEYRMSGCVCQSLCILSATVGFAACASICLFQELF